MITNAFVIVECMKKPDSPKRSRGIQSVEVGGQLLNALAHHGQALPLKDLARLAGMTPAKAHPYAVSFVQIGLMAQDPQGHYGLGELAMRMGLISLQQVDPVRLATPLIEQLAATTGHTAAMAVWGNHGATIVRVAPSPALVHVAMRLGAVMSLTGTATGALFAAHLPRAAMDLAVMTRDERALLTSAAFQNRLADIRARGLSRSPTATVPGTTAFSAPVFNVQGQIVLALTLIGLAPSFDGAWRSHLATSLRSAADGLSARLRPKLVVH
jgi:DNA-binding IclR family transcriptional regulator